MTSAFAVCMILCFKTAWLLYITVLLICEKNSLKQAIIFERNGEDRTNAGKDEKTAENYGITLVFRYI